MTLERCKRMMQDDIMLMSKIHAFKVDDLKAVVAKKKPRGSVTWMPRGM